MEMTKLRVTRHASRDIFGVPIEGFGWEKIMTMLRDGESLWLVTANPEILLEARKNPQYKETLKRASLRLVDGFGLFLAMLILRRKTKRLTGVELSEHLLQFGWHRELRIGFFGGENGEAEHAAEDARMAYKGIQIHVEQGGTVNREGKEDSATEEARHRMTMFSPQVLLVAMGHPRQERWIDAHRAEFPELKAVVGVGGTFNYWAGFSKRPPLWMRTLGLEWLGRLIMEPKRWKRIWQAVVVFPILFLLG
jgi:N-acetylglucosaminyldiphosphoundecaprenol N-acetyl-beta-D-mannosaminyltransferase